MKKTLKISGNVELVMESDNEMLWATHYHNKRTGERSPPLIMSAYGLWSLMHLRRKDKVRHYKRGKRNLHRRKP